MKTLLRELGTRGALIYAMDRALMKLRIGRAYDYSVMAVDLAALAANARQIPIDMALRALSPSQAAEIVIDVDLTVQKERFSQGATCFGLIRGDQSLGWIWAVPHIYQEDEVRAGFEFEDTAVWDLGVFVQPKLRVGRTFTYLWSAFARAQLAQGRRWSISRISRSNIASLKSHQRLPHREVARCAFISVLGLQVCFASCAPWLHVSISTASAPRFKVVMKS